MRKIKHQLMYALLLANHIGESKHAYQCEKGHNKTKGRIYSIDTYQRIKKIIKSFSGFLEEYYPEVESAIQISQVHYQAFINKNIGNWTTKTAKDKKDSLKTISAIIDNAFGSNTEWRDLIIPEGAKAFSIREGAMEREDFEKILNNLESNHPRSQAIKALYIVEKTGMRIKEITSLSYTNIDVSNMRINITEGAKNGRKRVIPIKNEDMCFWMKMRDESEKYFRLTGNPYVTCGVKRESIDKMIRISMREVGVSEKYCDTNHAIRKMVAEELYQGYKNQGLSKDEALGKVMNILGHSSTRKDLRKVYIRKI